MLNRRKQIANACVGMLCLIVSSCAVLLLLAIVVFMLQESWPVWVSQGFSGIAFSTNWNPLGDPPLTGIGTMIISTLWVAMGGLFIAAPIGFCAAIFLAEFAPPRLADIIRPVLNILTGIPSVVYGFLGAAVLVSFFEVNFNMASGESLFCASLILTVMVLPYIVATSEAALRAVPREYRQTALALGVSKPYLTLKVLVPLAKKGLVGALILAFGRAAGETMAVLMVAGNVLIMPNSWFSKGEPLSALIALELGSAEVGSAHYQGLFAAGLVLLIFVMAINLGLAFIRRDKKTG
ncbi:phosphate ABC transporter permease subunit PstC [Desulfofalx alkaliphila]|uniref:phosphate ABC transporter permease subunit PstC n=1 Tax=Desulfofalx alkaliphila TaxID=105483 RepID=UPI0004E0C560|nr:phosphate ABC transporter permease subunit PstC [Desulfofalx alkaliphila]